MAAHLYKAEPQSPAARRRCSSGAVGTRKLVSPSTNGRSQSHGRRSSRLSRRRPYLPPCGKPGWSHDHPSVHRRKGQARACPVRLRTNSVKTMPGSDSTTDGQPTSSLSAVLCFEGGQIGPDPREATCLLHDGHPGDHDFTPDDEIEIHFHRYDYPAGLPSPACLTCGEYRGA